MRHRDRPRPGLLKLLGVMLPFLCWVDKNVVRGTVGISVVAVAHPAK